MADRDRAAAADTGLRKAADRVAESASARVADTHAAKDAAAARGTAGAMTARASGLRPAEP